MCVALVAVALVLVVATGNGAWYLLPVGCADDVDDAGRPRRRHAVGP
jgi:hypothetical protein